MYMLICAKAQCVQNPMCANLQSIFDMCVSILGKTEESLDFSRCCFCDKQYGSRDCLGCPEYEGSFEYLVEG